MTDQVVGSADETSGASGATENKDQVSYETHRRLLNQYKKESEKLASIQSERDALSAQLKQIEENKLTEQGEYKKLLELRQKEVDEYKSKLTQTEAEKLQAQKNLVNTWKVQAFTEKLPGKLKGMEFLNFANLDGIALNPDTLEIDEKSVEGVVSDFTKKYPFLLDTKPVGSLPGAAPVTGKPLTYLDELKQCKTQAELNAVLKKHGRLG